MRVDLDAVLNAATLDVWGLRITYRPLYSAPTRADFQVTATWVHEPVTVLTEMAASEMKAAGHSTVAPVVGARLADLGLQPEPGDELIVDGKSYEVWDAKPDTSGWVELILREVLA